MFVSACLRKTTTIGIRGYKVTILGASGGIGRHLALLMKLNPKVTELSLYDVVNTPGIAADISHVSTPAKVTGWTGVGQIAQALAGSDVVLIPAGIPIAPKKHTPTPENEHLDFRDALFQLNAGIVMKLADACAENCPKAMFLIMSNPVNSTVPIFAESLKKHGVYDPRKLFGVTSLDVTRANTFVAANQGLDVNKTKVQVIGGHAGHTILPLLSHVPGTKFTPEDAASVTNSIQHGGEVVVKAKEGTGSATLSMAFACNWFTNRLLDAMGGEKNVIECAFVQNNLTPAPFFSTPLRLGPNGVEEVLPYGTLSPAEQATFDDLIPDLVEHAEKGVNFANSVEAANAAAAESAAK